MDILRRIIEGMRRRTLWQVLGLYAAGSWVALQLVDILANNFSLPDSFPAVALAFLLLGLPVVLATYFVQRRTLGAGNSVAGVADRATGTGMRRWLTWRNAVVGGVLAFALWGVVAALWLLSPGPSVPVGSEAGGDDPATSVVAVLPFSVRGSPDFDYLGGGMVSLLGTKLDGAGDLRSVDSRALLSAVEAGSERPSDPESGARLAERFGAGLFVIGDLVEIGGEFQIAAALYDTRNPARPIARTAVEGANAFELVDEMAAGLLAGVEGGPGARVRRIAAVTTTSLEAFRAYLRGEAEFRSGRFQEALEAFQTAVSVDSLYAMAYYRLSVAAEWLTRPAIEVAAAEKAFEHSARLSERDRRVLEAFLAWRRGAHREAERLYRAIVAEYPTDLEAWFQLGEIYFHANPLYGRSIYESRPVFERALSFEPDDAASIIHLIRLAAFEGRRSARDSLLERFYEVNPAGDRTSEMQAIAVFSDGAPARQEAFLAELEDQTNVAIWQVGWNTAIYTRNFPATLGVARILTADPRFGSVVRTTGHGLAAAALAAQGKFREAAAEIDAVEAYDSASAAEYRALLGLVPLARFDRAELESLRSALLAADPNSIPVSRDPSFFFSNHDGLHGLIRLFLAGMLSVALDDVAAAAEFAESLEGSSTPPKAGSLATDLAAGVRAQLMAADGRAEEALAILESMQTEVLYSWILASPYYSAVLQRYARGRALEALGRYEESLDWYANLGFLSVFEIGFLPAAALRQAEVNEALGRPAEAARHYVRFAEMWRHADPEYQDLVRQALEAARRLAPAEDS